MAAAAVCLLLAGGSSAAYAANVGGIQRTIQLWIDGDQTDVEFEYGEDGTYHLSYPEDDGSRQAWNIPETNIDKFPQDLDDFLTLLLYNNEKS